MLDKKSDMAETLNELILEKFKKNQVVFFHDLYREYHAKTNNKMVAFYSWMREVEALGIIEKIKSAEGNQYKILGVPK